jgi:pyruvate kinase
MKDVLEKLNIAMLRIYRHLRSIEQKTANATARVHARQHASALNLIHYLALRSSDLRDLQDDLHEAGLSSLASAESHVLWQVQAVLQRLGVQIPEKEASRLGFTDGVRLLQQRAHALFGPNQQPDIPYLMVTFDGSLAEDYISVKHLIKAGMNIARINCAHDDLETWLKMIQNVRKAAHTTGKPCKVYLDLAGP